MKILITTFKILQISVNLSVFESACFILSIFTFPVPVIDPVPTERFPEYVMDMLYGEENKLKTEFSVRAPY